MGHAKIFIKAAQDHIDRLPKEYQAEMLAYLIEGKEPRFFVASVLQNDLFFAANSLPLQYERDLRAVGTFLGVLPSHSWGSIGNYKRWMANGGLKGLYCHEVELEPESD